ncbi:MAG: polyphosphate:AMP phosphotransferase, partial [Desulfovibrio piger]|nr:polyphosphate:AMP phosphotransferase [Desulfovibrio piger]
MRLFNAQLQCIERKIPVLITVAGLVGSGRGAIINLLSEWMDSKHVQNHVFWLVTDEEKARPWPWRFWRQLPAAGQTAVFYDGWYGEAMRQRCCKDVGENEFTA